LYAQLSAGVALPQTLPSGSQFCFSVDYQFTRGWPRSSGRYYWVIEPTGAPPLVVPATLQKKGTLMLIESGVRPEAGPCRCYLVEAVSASQRRRISNVAAMK
jgi:hypothetical protein